jgi:predicted AAA+ superfamily ATPase
LKDQFDLVRAINHGLIPAIYLSNNPTEDLKAYVGTYLKEEIAAEGLTRNIPAFSRFLEVAALCNGQLINYTNISNDAQVARSTVQEYFQILKDTLVGYEVGAWRVSKKRKPISTSKFYLFDVGVARFLQNRLQIQQGSPEFGECFETYIAGELRTYCDYHSLPDITYWRSKSGYEVDFVITDQTAIEVKASKNIAPHDLRGLKALQEEKVLKRYLVVCLEKNERKMGSIQVLPWEIFLVRLWAGEYV